MTDAHTIAQRAAQSEAARRANARATAINAAEAARRANLRASDGSPTWTDVTPSPMSRDSEMETSIKHVGKALSFFASVIKSGEPWTPTCQAALDLAREDLSRLSGAPGAGDGARDGLALIAAERHRQVAEKGFTAERDDGYTREELAAAAIHYALTDWDYAQLGDQFWPADWDERWNQKDADDRITQLTKAGALIAAEIDRLNRGTDVTTETKRRFGLGDIPEAQPVCACPPDDPCDHHAVEHLAAAVPVPVPGDGAQRVDLPGGVESKIVEYATAYPGGRADDVLIHLTTADKTYLGTLTLGWFRENTSVADGEREATDGGAA